MIPISGQPVTAICFLAGGQARRMGGGDKAFIEIGGLSILERQMRTTCQHQLRLINANGQPERFTAFGLPVIKDCVAGFLGPLAGILSGLEYLALHHSEIEWMISCATDVPFFPQDLSEALHDARRREASDLAMVISAGRTHPVFSLWPLAIAPALRRALIDEKIRKIDVFASRYRVAYAVFDSQPDLFMNINTPEDVRVAQAQAVSDER